jgi:putative aldouronate transport system substrate-binding protein
MVGMDGTSAAECAFTRRALLRAVGLGSAVLVLTACQAVPGRGGETSRGSGPPSGTPLTPEALTLPITKQPLRLSYWSALDTNAAATMNSMAEMACYQELEKRTGIHLEFQHPPQAAQTEQFNLLVASGRYPDVIEVNWLTSYAGGPAKALKDGVILRLNDLIDKYAPNLKQVLSDHPEWRRQMVTDEGDLYCFPFVRSDPILLTSNGPTVRGDWLDKVGLQRPTTLDEWHTTLQAFKAQKPGGQGNVLPFTPWWGGNVHGAFSYHMFIGAWGVTTGMYQQQGAVKYGPVQPEFKEFLRTLADWFKEGLIDPDYPTTDQSSYDAKVTGSLLGSSVMAGGRGIGKFMGLMADKDPTFKLVGSVYPTLQRGTQAVLGQRDNPVLGVGAGITSANKNVTETVKLLDFGYSEAGHLLFNFGIEGKSYTLEGGFPRFSPEVMRNPQGLPSGQAISRYARSVASGPFIQDPRYITQYYELPEQQEALKLWVEPVNDRLLPPLTPSQEESRKYARIATDASARLLEMLTKVVMGREPVDSWDGVTQEFKQMGIDEGVKVQQAALDRYHQRV